MKDLEQELYETKAKLQKLRQAVWPLIEGLQGRPRSQWYFLRLNHPAIDTLYNAYKETEDEK